ncbi:protein mono-ADP-ribosyltransferase PARP11-like [Clarias gariepinus]
MIILGTGSMKQRVTFGTELRCKCADQAPSVPAHWEKMDDITPYKAFTVDRQTSEFEEVERYVREIGLLQEPLKYIYRIQNVDLWELYCRKKSQLMRIKGQSEIEERMLFHGTGKNYVDSICLYNFDCRISESVRYGHLYGKGTYFSIHASYADMYSKFRSQGHTNETRIMFLARVIVGNYTTGQQRFCKPDGDKIENIHDSCVDDTLYPRTFVIFNSNQIYPEYVLEYGG